MAGLRMRILVDSSTFIALAKIINYEGDARGLRLRNSNGLKFTGLIGLLVAAVKTKRVERENFIKLFFYFWLKPFSKRFDLIHKSQQLPAYSRFNRFFMRHHSF
jgi:hypothetical protein